ncbi:MAG: nucleotidyltransferase substrate binding protein [Spirochaetaceae bacterium]|nr:nucleotidyltransferase substrate binding protein [Spirochaetaceae bacterium]
MDLQTDSLKRCIDTLDASVAMLLKAQPESIEREVLRNAVIKGFELTLETSGKLLRRALKEYAGSPRAVDELAFKDLFREGLKRGFVKDAETVRRWFAYWENRNSTAHDYGLKFAEETLKLIPPFLDDAKILERDLRRGSTGA